MQGEVCKHKTLKTSTYGDIGTKMCMKNIHINV